MKWFYFHFSAWITSSDNIISQNKNERENENMAKKRFISTKVFFYFLFFNFVHHLWPLYKQITNPGISPPREPHWHFILIICSNVTGLSVKKETPWWVPSFPDLDTSLLQWNLQRNNLSFKLNINRKRDVASKTTVLCAWSRWQKMQSITIQVNLEMKSQEWSTIRKKTIDVSILQHTHTRTHRQTDGET